MEKRFLLAMILSFLVLYAWSLSLPKNLKESPQKLSQILENKEDREIKIAASAPSEPSFLPARLEEKITSAESDKFRLEFSNLGGVLKNISLKKFDVHFLFRDLIALTGEEHREFSLVSAAPEAVQYFYETKEQKITKIYSFPQDDYVLRAEIIAENKTNDPQSLDIKTNGLIIDMSILDNKNGDQYDSHLKDRNLFEYSVYAPAKILRKDNAARFSVKDDKKEMTPISWIGFRDRYFCVLIKPNEETKGYAIESVSDKVLKMEIDSGHVSIPPKGNVQFSYQIFVGPQDYGLLKKYNMGFENIMVFSRYALLDGISKIIYHTIQFFHKIIPSWGLCILLISVLIYSLMYPMTLRGMQSMKKMQALQPKIAKLKEKYKDNPQKMNKETMEIYREHKINPLGGCLPFLLQMPVFVGLYQVLWRSVAFKGAKFLWIKDLSEPDRLFILPTNLPIIGNEINILPFIMAIAMFVQQKISSKNTVAVDSAQQMQQKMMGTIFPVFLGFIFYKFASGLTLYFTMFYIFSTFTQWKMSKEKVAA